MSRIVSAGLAAAALTVALASGAHADTPHSPQPPRPSCSDGGTSPFQGMKLDGLKAVKKINMPGPLCTIYVWELVLDDERLGAHYSGGEFFLYSSEEGTFGGFLNGDLKFRSVREAGRVAFTYSDAAAHKRVEVRYGDPQHPEYAQVIASVTR
ncbi:hypothetical protein ACWF95_39025 [Streptomyces vinaceus]